MPFPQLQFYSNRSSTACSCAAWWLFAAFSLASSIYHPNPIRFLCLVAQCLGQFECCFYLIPSSSILPIHPFGSQSGPYDTPQHKSHVSLNQESSQNFVGNKGWCRLMSSSQRYHNHCSPQHWNTLHSPAVLEAQQFQYLYFFPFPSRVPLFHNLHQPYSSSRNTPAFWHAKW